jgi:broad specificity phosphatase PhoE
MAFLLLIIEPRGQRDTRTDAEGKQCDAQMVRCGEGLAARGQLVASQSLHATPLRRGVAESLARHAAPVHGSPDAAILTSAPARSHQRARVTLPPLRVV